MSIIIQHRHTLSTTLLQVFKLYANVLNIPDNHTLDTTAITVIDTDQALALMNLNMIEPLLID